MNKIALLFIISIALSACQRNHKTQRFSNWNQVNEWSFNGKMAIKDQRNNGSGRISWNRSKNSTQVEFKAPLGQGNWKLTEDLISAKLLSSKNGTTTATNAKLLLSNELGWDFPWNQLKFWIRGYHQNQVLNPHKNLPKVINDLGWKIDYQAWMNTPLGMLPKKIKASKDEYSVKLIIYNWEIQP